MAAQWYYAHQGQQVGPVGDEQVRGLVASGVLKPTDLVWSEGLPAWTPANQVPGLLAPLPAFARLAFPPPSPAALPVPGGVSEDTLALLRATKPWVRLLSVLGFIGLGFLVLGSLAFLLIPMGGMGAMSLGPKVAITSVYLAMGCVQFPAVLFLSRYASRIGNLAASGAPADLEEALRAQKSFWKYVGILTLVMIGFYVVVIVIALGVGGAALMGR